MLVGEQLLVLRQARSAGEQEAQRAAGLEERLNEAADGPQGRIARLKDGALTHQVPEAQIVFVRAADDYCEARLADGRTLLVTMSLSRLQQALSERPQQVVLGKLEFADWKFVRSVRHAVGASCSGGARGGMAAVARSEAGRRWA